MNRVRATRSNLTRLNRVQAPFEPGRVYKEKERLPKRCEPVRTQWEERHGDVNKNRSQ